MVVGGGNHDVIKMIKCNELQSLNVRMDTLQKRHIVNTIAKLKKIVKQME